MHMFFSLKSHNLFQLIILSIMTALILQLIEETEHKNLLSFVFSLFLCHCPWLKKRHCSFESSLSNFSHYTYFLTDCPNAVLADTGEAIQTQ